jgi:hypothetical protein
MAPHQEDRSANQALRASAFRLAAKIKRRMRRAPWLWAGPLLRYTYLLQPSAGIVVPELKMNFVPTPKVANRSMKAAIASVVRPGYRGDPHLAGWRYRRVSALRVTGYFGFGFVRNPLDRLYSCYAQKIVYYGRVMNKPLVFWRYGGTFGADMSFEDFVKAVAAIPDRIADPHFRSQYRFLYRGREPVVDFIGRFESLERDWAVVRERFGLPVLPHYNRSPRGSYTSAYTPELARIAADRYRKDIRLFGYDEEVAALARRWPIA